MSFPLLRLGLSWCYVRLERLFGAFIYWVELCSVRAKPVSFDALCPFSVAVGGCVDGESLAFSSDPVSIVADVCHTSAVHASVPRAVNIYSVAFAAFSVVECCVRRVL